MPMSEYVRRLRSRIGNDLLLLPGVTAAVQRGDFSEATKCCSHGRPAPSAGR
jgi:hypothetical protein